MTAVEASCPACGGGASVARSEWFGDLALLRCPACRTEWVHPQPSDARLAEIYGTEYYEPWSFEGRDGLDEMKRRTFRPVLDLCQLRSGGSILDVGCATGSFLSFASGRGLRSFGIDLNEHAVEEARRGVTGIQVHCGVLGDQPFEGQVFDAITMFDFIEHVRDPSAELSAARQRLAPAGRLAISTPRVDSIMRTLLRGAWPQYREEHLSYFSRKGLIQLLDRCGYSVESTRTTRKAVTLAYSYGQALAYPARVVTPAMKIAYRVLPLMRHTPVSVPFGEMTVVSTRRT